MGLSEDADPTLCKLISSLASPKLPDPAFTQIPLCFPERQGLPHPSGPVLW